MTDARSGGGPWRDRTIVVTGGSSGIGRQFAVHFAAEGAKVIACGRNDIALRELRTEHPTIETVQCDITVRQNVLALVETIRDRYGMLDVLVNNAGVMEPVDLLQKSVSDERIAQKIAVNLTGPILLTRRLLPLL
ncbi:MAG: SDR family NAD(P)-dependent oxidoreductase, partial [Acetobacteraceae bacterium]